MATRVAEAPTPLSNRLIFSRPRRAYMEAMLKTLLILASMPALGMVETTKETFSGFLDSGELLLVSDDRGGTECRGMASRGVVVVRCEDGREGVIRFRGYNGYGNLDGEPFTVVLN